MNKYGKNQKYTRGIYTHIDILTRTKKYASVNTWM
jgi:hypothetical protein